MRYRWALRSWPKRPGKNSTQAARDSASPAAEPAHPAASSTDSKTDDAAPPADATAKDSAPAGAGTAEVTKPTRPVLVHIGPVTLRPTAYVDMAGVSRSDMTADSMNTKFAKIPLADTPSGSQGTMRTSRMLLTGTVPIGEGKLTGYMESDFMNFTANQPMYRWRRYWGRFEFGKWELLGGQAWSLLRPNRVGPLTEKDMMHTDVLDSAYQVGLLGSRVRQVRVVRTMGAYHAAVAWEGDGNMLGKISPEAALSRQLVEPPCVGGSVASHQLQAEGFVPKPLIDVAEPLEIREHDFAGGEREQVVGVACHEFHAGAGLSHVGPEAEGTAQVEIAQLAGIRLFPYRDDGAAPTGGGYT